MSRKAGTAAAGAAQLRAQALAAQKAGRLSEAFTLWGRVLAAAPQDAGAWSNLGALLRAMGEPSAAVLHQRRAHGLAPEAPLIAINLARALTDLGEVEEALSLRLALARRLPQEPWSRGGIAAALRRCGRDAEAEAEARAALGRPELRAEAGVELARFALIRGAWTEAAAVMTQVRAAAQAAAEGTAEGAAAGKTEGKTEGRAAAKRSGAGAARRTGAPVGAAQQASAASPPAGGAAPPSHFLRLEGGWNDLLLLSRFLRLPQAAALGQVLIPCPAPLRRLLAAQLEGAPVAVRLLEENAVPPPESRAVPLLDLPAMLEAAAGAPPPASPPLPGAPPARAAPDAPSASAPRMRWIPGMLKLGLIPQAEGERRLHPPLVGLAELAALPGVQACCLALGEGAARIAAAPEAALLPVPLPPDADFLDLAQAAAELDLAVCADGPAAHAAALSGTPTLTLAPRGGHWSLGATQEACAWSPGMRILRPAPGDGPGWEEMFARATAMIAARTGPGQAQPVRATAPGGPDGPG